MNNIYVDELPKDCLNCPCRDGESNKCNLIEFRPSIGYFDEKTLDFVYKPYYNKGEILDCPLKPLSTRLAEERKKVVQEIKELCEEKKENGFSLFTGKFDGVAIMNMAKLYDILDQIEGESDERNFV